jgi:hypothetical protein
MRYFSYIAEQSFKSDAEGRRLFCLGGPFSRPYFIPDEAAERRLFGKLTWHYRIFLSILILGQPFLFPYLFRKPWLFYVYLASVIAVQWAVLRLVFYSDLRALGRAPTRLSMKMFCLNMAQKHSVARLALGLFGSLAFVFIGALMCFAGGWMLALGLTPVVFFGWCAVAWGYALRLKLAARPK